MSFLGGTKVSQPSLDVDRSTLYIISISISPAILLGFSGGADSKEFACNEEDLGSTPGLGRSPGEGKGYPPQYSWASLVAQMVKNPLAMQEIWVQPLGWEDPLEKGTATHYRILTWRIPWTEEPGRLQSVGLQRVGHD